MTYKIMSIGFLVMLFTGCQGANRAQVSLAAGNKANSEVRQAFFIKSWTLNRALITEAREKWVSKAEKQMATGNLTVEEAAQILIELNKNIGLDEAVTSENFAYLTYLLVAGERADQYFGQVDQYLEARKPIWKHLFRHGRTTTTEIVEEIEAWKPILENIRDVIPKSLSSNSPSRDTKLRLWAEEN